MAQWEWAAFRPFRTVRTFASVKTRSMRVCRGDGLASDQVAACVIVSQSSAGHLATWQMKRYGAAGRAKLTRVSHRAGPRRTRLRRQLQPAGSKSHRRQHAQRELNAKRLELLREL